MTISEAEALVLQWDACALNQGKPEVRKRLWRILDALAGWQEPETAREALDSLHQTPQVAEIKKVLGLYQEEDL